MVELRILARHFVFNEVSRSFTFYNAALGALSSNGTSRVVTVKDVELACTLDFLTFLLVLFRYVSPVASKPSSISIYLGGGIPALKYFDYVDERQDYLDRSTSS